MCRRCILLLSALTACNIHVDYSGTNYTCTPPDGDCPPGTACSLDGHCLAPTGADAAPPDATLPDAGAPVPWWDPAYRRRRLVTVENGGLAIVPNGLAVHVLLDSATLQPSSEGEASIVLMHYDPSDDSWYEMARTFAKLPTASEDLWFRLEEKLGPNETIAHYYLYYDNPGFTTPADDNPGHVFDFYRGFDTNNTSGLTTQGTTSVASSELTLDSGAAVRSLSTYGPGTAVDFDVRLTPIVPNVVFGFHRANDFADDNPLIGFVTALDTLVWLYARLQVPLETAQTTASADIMTSVDRHTYTVERLADHVIYRLDTLEVARFDTAYTEDLQVRADNDGIATIHIDDIRVREVVDPMPTVTIGPEELAP